MVWIPSKFAAFGKKLTGALSSMDGCEWTWNWFLMFLEMAHGFGVVATTYIIHCRKMPACKGNTQKLCCSTKLCCLCHSTKPLLCQATTLLCLAHPTTLVCTCLPHRRSWGPWGPFYLWFHFYLLLLYHAIPHALVLSFICTFTSMGSSSFPLWISC